MSFLFPRRRTFQTLTPLRSRTELLRFLDDCFHQKRYPSDRSRFLPGEHIVHTEPQAVAPVPNLDSRFRWSLARVSRFEPGCPVFSWCGRGDREGCNPWSASKFLSIALASLCLRENGLGLTLELQGLPLGDLVTLVCSYDSSRAYGRAPLNSNNVASYFHSLIGPEKPTVLLHRYLDSDRTAHFETSYGTRFFDDPRIPVPEGYAGARGRGRGLKRMTLRGLAEGFCRTLAVLHPDDLQTLLYGAADSRWYPAQLGDASVEMGGMCTDPSVYFQNALNLERVESESRGLWRIFSKLGYGPAKFERDNHFVVVGYLYLPVVDKEGKARADLGRECVVAASFDGTGLEDEEADRRFAECIAKLLDGSVEPFSKIRSTSS